MVDRSKELESIKTLVACKQDIRETLHRHREEILAVKKQQSFDLDTVLAVAQNLAYSRHAPPGWVPGAPLIKHHPPAPQPEQMRGGMLEKFYMKCKAQASEEMEGVGVAEVSGIAREVKGEVFRVKETVAIVQESSSVDAPMDVEPSVAAGPAPVQSHEDINVSKGRKSNTISFTSYSDDESDDD